MTIPQGDNRGPQSISDRRKVTYAGNSPGTGQQSSKTSATQSTLSDGNVSTCSNSITDIENIEEETGEFEGDFMLIDGEGAEKIVRNIRSQSLLDRGHLEVNVTVVSPTDSKKASQPLLNVLKSDVTGHSSDRSRKLSLNLTRPFYRENIEAQKLERTRRFSQPQKLSYQRVPQDEPSPLSVVPEIFTLQHVGQVNQAFKYRHQKVSTYSAEVHASFHDRSESRDNRFSKHSSSLESSATKRFQLGKQRTLTRIDSTSCRSLDDLALVDHGGGSKKAKTFPTNRSASSEDISACRKKTVTSSGSSGGNHPRRQPGGHQPSSSSPSHCCLVSVSRVPMAAATSHLTLDSDYQSVRLAVLGAPGVGKSSIVRQFVMQQFMEEYVPTEQRQVYCPAVIINEHLYEVRIIDCPYIPYFPVNSLYEWTDFRGYGLRNATAYVLVYDITSEESFEYIKSLRLQILESRNRHDVPIFVVGNKHDLAEERGVPRREVREIANLVKKQWKCGYIECSAKYNWHIMLLFKELMKTVDYIDYGHKPTSMRVQDALRRNRCLIL